MADKFAAISYLGTKIMSNVILIPPTKEYLLPGYQASDFDRVLLNDVMVEVSANKNIVTTQLTRPQGFPNADTSVNSDRRVVSFEGTVKEYISLGDYTITLRGMLVNEVDEAPLDLLRAVVKYCEYPGNFLIGGKFLDPFDFTNVVVKSFRKAETKFQNMYSYTMTLLSDEYVNVKYESVREGTETT